MATGVRRRARVRRLLGWLLRLVAVLVVIVVALGLMLIHRPARHVPSVPEIQDYVYLDQGWGKARDAAPRQAYYYTPQGTSLKNLRYDWLVHLEMPWGRKRLADPAHLRSYGFIVDPERTAANPDQLPVGFARRFDPELGDDVVDISCAVCHTGQLVVDRAGKRTAIRIDGGPASHAFTTDASSAISCPRSRVAREHVPEPLQVRRFAHQVLGESAYARGRDRLYDDLGEVLSAFVQAGVEANSSRHLYPVEEGFGRTDALGTDRATPSSPTSWTARTIAVGERAGELSVPVEHLEVRLGAVQRLGQPAHGAQHGRVASGRGPAAPPGSLTAARCRRDRALPHVGSGREPATASRRRCSVSRRRSGRRTCWARSTGSRPNGAASCSSRTAGTAMVLSSSRRT